jgi:hypothetical protein
MISHPSPDTKGTTMVVLNATVVGSQGAAMTRELTQRAKQISGVTGSLASQVEVAESKGAGEAIAAILTVGVEKAIGPLVEILGHVFVRDKKARIRLKLPNGMEVEIDSSNMETEFKALHKLLNDLLPKQKS